MGTEGSLKNIAETELLERIENVLLLVRFDHSIHDGDGLTPEGNALARFIYSEVQHYCAEKGKK